MSDLVSQTLALLADEKIAIQTADFKTITTLSDKKQELLNDLMQAQAKLADVRRIKQALTHNHALLGAAIAGVGAARERLVALEKVRGGLSVYDQSGQIAKVPTGRPDMEHKA